MACDAALRHPGAAAARAPGAAGHRAPAAALHVDVALPEIKQQIAWPNFNPVSLIKEAADKQKVVCKWVESCLPPRPGLYPPQFRHQVIWEGQVSRIQHVIVQY